MQDHLIFYFTFKIKINSLCFHFEFLLSLLFVNTKFLDLEQIFS
jgi:hypothetical protein